MRIRLGELRRLLRESTSLIQFPKPTFRFGSSVPDTERFVSQIVEPLKDLGALPAEVGPLLDSGFEGIVCSLGNDKVIKLIATYDAPSDFTARHVSRLRNAPSGGMYVAIFDSGTVDAVDPSTGETYTVLVYGIMERLSPLSNDEAEVIFMVANEYEMKPKEVKNERLRDFLKNYMRLDVDHDVRNVMKRGDQYVIIDPE